ncbi:MAG: hypothetical protein Q4D85_03880 [Corynebacterium sp.]|uniref:hypothetical protein n=1 Tax=Corynebacterium sp. TaxID=1720 RepID=UPI0026DA969B|nr:hypothetical protein [Corynebacterium sp.]MDO5097874.1 hypothetical protein [Corynebacterium sp.]
MNKLKLAIGCLVVGVVSLVFSLIAAGIDYRMMEHEHPVYNTPQWILMWNAVSLIVVVIAAIATVAVLVLKAAGRRKAKG